MEQQKNDKPQLRGLYGKIHISVKTLDKVIIGGIIAIVLVLSLGLSKRGYEIRFDSLGGTPVQSQKHMYGEKLTPTGIPTREGYRFKGWYRDKECTLPWNLETDTVTEKMNLYASWEVK